MSRRLDRVVNLGDMERLARRRLPRGVYDAIAGGATDEVTLAANRDAFGKLWLRPRALPDLSAFDASTTVLGRTIPYPVMLAPTGMARMCDSGAEAAVARASARAGTIFCVSSGASQSLEDIADAVRGEERGMESLWYQLYLQNEQAATEAIIDRAKQAGYPVLILTIDNGVPLRRERDIRNGFSIPVRMSPKLVLAGLAKPRWTKDFLLGKVGRVGSGQGHGSYAAKPTGRIVAAYGAYRRLERVVANMRMPTWEDLRFVRERWDGPLVVKGLMRGDEVPAMLDLGVDALIVSNHGGRNIDSVRASIDVLPEVVAAAAGRAEVYMDGGVRRGTDVVKALALGARAVMIGRPYMWGLAAGGEAGVTAVCDFFGDEVRRTMGMCGLRSIADVDAAAVHAER